VIHDENQHDAQPDDELMEKFLVDVVVLVLLKEILDCSIV
jgi:hypothetical protein